jgi:hypothetical protein
MTEKTFNIISNCIVYPFVIFCIFSILANSDILWISECKNCYQKCIWRWVTHVPSLMWGPKVSKHEWYPSSEGVVTFYKLFGIREAFGVKLVGPPKNGQAVFMFWGSPPETHFEMRHSGLITNARSKSEQTWVVHLVRRCNYVLGAIWDLGSFWSETGGDPQNMDRLYPCFWSPRQTTLNIHKNSPKNRKISLRSHQIKRKRFCNWHWARKLMFCICLNIKEKKFLHLSQ